MEPRFGLARMILGLAYTEKQMYSEALAQLKLAADQTERWPMCLGALGYAQRTAGFTREARELLDELRQRSRTQYVSPVFILEVAFGLQSADDVLSCLDEALEVRAAELIYVGLSPAFDSIRSTPQFLAACRHIGVPVQV